MLGEVTPDLLDYLGVDAVRVGLPNNFYGFRNEDWKPWTTFDGTPVLVPGEFPTEPEPNGDLLMYPNGDRSAPPCARMPAGGFYFDAITRQEPLDEHLDPADNLEEFAPIDDEALEHIRARSSGSVPPDVPCSGSSAAPALATPPSCPARLWRIPAASGTSSSGT